MSASGSDRRVAITGIGIVSSLGAGREANWEHMVAGLCGLRPVTLFDVSAFRSQIAGEIDTFDLQARFTPYQRRRWSRSEQLGVVAATEAFDDAGLLDGQLDRTRVGVLLGAGTGDLLRNEEYDFQLLTEGIDRTRPTWIHHHFSNAPVDVLAQHFDLQGARSCVVAACSSSTIAIGQAADLILDGELDAAICGGTDALARLTFSGFNALRLMDPEPCKPFDKARQGMSIGEGAAMLVLEDMARAKARGATIYAELAGYGLSCEAYHATAPSPRAGPSAGPSPARSRAPAWPWTRSTMSTATARRRRRTIGPRPAACTWSSATVPAASRSTRSSRWSATASGPPARSRRRCSP